MFKLIPLLLWFLLLLQGCVKPVPLQLYETMPTLPALASASPMAVREVPVAERKTLHLHVDFSKAKEADFVNRLHMPELKHAPRILVSLPFNDEDKGQSNLNESQQDLVQREVEKTLLKQSFILVDAVRFMADVGMDRQPKRHAKLQQGYDQGTLNALQALRYDLEHGRLNVDEYLHKKRALVNDPQGQPAVRKIEPLPQQKELLERIRMARQSSKGKAVDLLLVVESLQVKTATEHAVAINQLAPVRDYLNNNPELHTGPAAGQMPAHLMLPWFSASMKARLLRTDTMEVVWLGDHAVDLRSALPDGVEVELDMVREVANADTVAQARQSYNAQLREANGKQGNARQQLLRLYREASQPKVMADKETALREKSRMEDAVYQEEQSFRAAKKQVHDLALAPPAEARQSWHYRYRREAPQLQPDLTQNEALAAKQQTMLKALVRGLMKTIDVL